jgi:hypothetical protein
VPRSHYEFLDELARSEKSRVLRARDRRTDRVVAIKETRSGDDAYARQLEAEALLYASLQHPSIVPVYEIGRWTNGEPFYAMKLVTGRSLADALRATSSLQERLTLLPHIEAVANAIAYAHGERVLHGKLSAVDVRVGKFGETIVLGWSNATRLGASALDELADRRSLGAMLRELLLGARVGADTSLDPGATPASDAPRTLVEIAERATTGDANHSPTAKEIAEELRRFRARPVVAAPIPTSTSAPSPTPTPTPSPTTAASGWQQWIASHPTLVAATVLGLALLVIAAALH